MRGKDAPRHTAGLEQRKAEQDRVAHTRPDGLGNILVERDVLHQHGVDGHADNDEEGLEREGKEASEVVLTYASICSPKTTQSKTEAQARKPDEDPAFFMRGLTKNALPLERRFTHSFSSFRSLLNRLG